MQYASLALGDGCPCWKVIVLTVTRCVFHVDGKWMSTRGGGQSRVDASGQGGGPHTLLLCKSTNDKQW